MQFPPLLDINRIILYVRKHFFFILFFRVCKSCKKRFCAEHLYPERHQCEEESKQEEYNPYKTGINNEVLKERAQAAL